MQARKATQGGRNDDDYGGDRMTDAIVRVPAQAVQMQLGVRQLIRQKVETDQEKAMLRVKVAEATQAEALQPEQLMEPPEEAPLPETPIPSLPGIPLQTATEDSPANPIPPADFPPTEISGRTQAQVDEPLPVKPPMPSESHVETPADVPVSAAPDVPQMSQAVPDITGQTAKELPMQKVVPAVQTSFHRSRSPIPKETDEPSGEGHSKAVKEKQPKAAIFTEGGKAVSRTEERPGIRKRQSRPSSTQPEQAIRFVRKEKQRQQTISPQENAVSERAEYPTKEGLTEAVSTGPVSIREKSLQVSTDAREAACGTDEPSSLPVKTKGNFASKTQSSATLEHPAGKEKRLPTAAEPSSRKLSGHSSRLPVKEKNAYLAATSVGEETERPAIKEKRASAVAELPGGSTAKLHSSLPIQEERMDTAEASGVEVTGERPVIKEKHPSVVPERPKWGIKEKGAPAIQERHPPSISEKPEMDISHCTDPPFVKEKNVYGAEVNAISADDVEHLATREKCLPGTSTAPEKAASGSTVHLPVKEKAIYVAEGDKVRGIESPDIRAKAPLVISERLKGAVTGFSSPSEPSNSLFIKGKAPPPIAERPQTPTGKQPDPSLIRKKRPFVPAERQREPTVAAQEMPTVETADNAIPDVSAASPKPIPGSGIKERPASAFIIKPRASAEKPLIKTHGSQEPSAQTESMVIVPPEPDALRSKENGRFPATPAHIQAADTRTTPKQKVASPTKEVSLTFNRIPQSDSICLLPTVAGTAAQTKILPSTDKSAVVSKDLPLSRQKKGETLPIQAVREKDVTPAVPGRQSTVIREKLRHREQPIKTVKHSTKGLRPPVKTKSATSQEGARQAMKTAVTAQKATQQTLYTAQEAEAAKTAAEKSTKAVGRILKLLTENARNLMTALAAGGGIVAALVLVICLVGLVIASPFGLFFAAENDDPCASSVSSAVAVVQADYDTKLEQLQSGSYDSVDISGETPSWSDVLAVFAVKTAGTDSDGRDVATLDTDRVDLLTEIFWDMTEITTEVETIDHPGDDDDDDGWTEYILHITITAKTLDEMRTKYGFTNYQNTALDELLADPDALNALIGSLSISDEDMQAIVDTLPAALNDKRQQVVHNALSLVGKVTYFWGGKSSAIGWDDRWGTLKKVTAGGNSTSGTYQPFGLDCSGFIGWCLINAGLQNDRNWFIGRNLVAVSQAEALPGDIAIFPDHSHVGLIVGRNEAGKLLVCHCSYSKNGVVVTEFSATGFTVIGKPILYGD